MKFKIAIVFVCFGLLTRAVCYGQYMSAKEAQANTTQHITESVRQNRNSVTTSIADKIREAGDNGYSHTTLTITWWPGVDQQFIDSQLRKLRRLRYKVTATKYGDDETSLSISWGE